MCSGERISTSQRAEHHLDCSCMSMASVLRPRCSSWALKGLVLAVGCCLLPCALGESAPLHLSHSLYRGATDVFGKGFSGVSTLNQDTFKPGTVIETQHATSSVGGVRRRSLQTEDLEAEDGDHVLDQGRVWNVVGAVCVILVVTLIGVFLPSILKRTTHQGSRGLIIESVCTAFAAGGFWGLALLHVLLEAIDSLALHNLGIRFPHAFMNASYPLVCLGYFMMLAIETCAKVASRKNLQAVGGASSDEQIKLASIDAAVACIALTVHSLFEGMIIGMRDTVLLIWVACISVAGHKWAAAFALSQRMSVHQAPAVVRWIFLTTFVVATPIGAFIGLPLSNLEDTPTSGIFNALSAGILIFVAAECTNDVFGGTHVSGAKSRENKRASSDWELEGRRGGSDEPKREEKVFDIRASVRVLLGQLFMMAAGFVLVFGMMCLHMRNPGHVH